MTEIQIMEKPQWITFEDIHELLYSAHASNREKGFNVHTAEMNGEELQALLGEKGKCFVALDGDKLVGTTSYRIIKRNYWCVKEEVVDRILIGVHPDYKGQHISRLLFDRIQNEVQYLGYKYIETRTADKNVIMQKINLNAGARYIDFRSYPVDHYTVIMLQWLNGCPYSQFQTDFHFKLRRFLVKLRYKPGHIKRFGI